MQTIKSAIIGCGAIAGGYDSPKNNKIVLTHANAFRLNKSTELIAVYDNNKNQLSAFKKKWNVPYAFTTLDELLNEAKPHIVSICSPTEFHYEHFKLIAKHPSVKVILCEKPLSYSLKQSKIMAKIAETNQVCLLVNYLRAWDPTFVKIGNEIRNKKFGELTNITVRYTKRPDP